MQCQLNSTGFRSHRLNKSTIIDTNSTEQWKTDAMSLLQTRNYHSYTFILFCLSFTASITFHIGWVNLYKWNSYLVVMDPACQQCFASWWWVFNCMRCVLWIRKDNLWDWGLTGITRTFYLEFYTRHVWRWGLLVQSRKRNLTLETETKKTWLISKYSIDALAHQI